MTPRRHEAHGASVALVLDVLPAYMERRRHEVHEVNVGLDVLRTFSRVGDLGAIEALASCVFVVFVASWSLR